MSNSKPVSEMTKWDLWSEQNHRYTKDGVDWWLELFGEEEE